LRRLRRAPVPTPCPRLDRLTALGPCAGGAPSRGPRVRLGRICAMWLKWRPSSTISSPSVRLRVPACSPRQSSHAWSRCEGVLAGAPQRSVDLKRPDRSSRAGSDSWNRSKDWSGPSQNTSPKHRGGPSGHRTSLL
jgi:hypothetical protein